MIGRIRDRPSFERLRRDGRRFRIDPLWCIFVPEPTCEPARIAFALGRAVGNAVARNRLRRRLRATLAAADLPGGLLLIGADRRANELTFVELERLVGRLAADLRGAART